MMPVEIMAELGSCHEGDVGRFRQLIALTKESGCTHAKAQFWSSTDRMVARRHAEAYRTVYQRYSIPLGWLNILRQECERVGLVPACSVYLPEDVSAVAELVDVLKVSSFEAGREMVDACRSTGKRVVVSTGMTDADHVYEWWQDATVLHCVSAYPAPLDQLNLSVIRENGYDGFSDHSGHVLTGAFAVAAGARMIEVHIRLHDTDRTVPDFAVALGPRDLMTYMQHIRLAEQMLGSDVKAVQPCEQPMLRYKVGA